jgi:hypothetical protein
MEEETKEKMDGGGGIGGIGKHRIAGGLEKGFGREPSMGHSAFSSTRKPNPLLPSSSSAFSSTFSSSSASLSSGLLTPSQRKRYIEGADHPCKKGRWSPIALTLLAQIDDEVAGKLIWSHVGTHTMATILAMRFGLVDMMGTNLKDLMLACVSKYPFLASSSLSSSSSSSLGSGDETPVTMDMGMLFSKMGARLSCPEEVQYVKNTIRQAAEAGIQYSLCMQQCGICCKFRTLTGETFSPYCSKQFPECHQFAQALTGLACGVKMDMQIRKMQGDSDKDLVVRCLKIHCLNANTPEGQLILDQARAIALEFPDISSLILNEISFTTPKDTDIIQTLGFLRNIQHASFSNIYSLNERGMPIMHLGVNCLPYLWLESLVGFGGRTRGGGAGGGGTATDTASSSCKLESLSIANNMLPYACMMKFAHLLAGLPGLKHLSFQV